MKKRVASKMTDTHYDPGAQHYIGCCKWRSTNDEAKERCRHFYPTAWCSVWIQVYKELSTLHFKESAGRL